MLSAAFSIKGFKEGGSKRGAGSLTRHGLQDIDHSTNAFPANFRRDAAEAPATDLASLSDSK